MVVAIPVEQKSLSSAVCLSFGRTPMFVLFNTEDGSSSYLDNNAAASQGGAGIQASQALADHRVDAVITYRLGENAAAVLETAGIAVYKAESVSIESNLQKLARGTLAPLKDIHPGLHNHGGSSK